MRRVNVKLGIKQRMNELLGSGENETGVINDWSIQSAMIANAQRVAKGIVGEAINGRIMRGLVISQNSNTYVRITEGYGFTPEGNVAFLNSPLINIPVIDISGDNGVVNFYLKHTLVAAPGDDFAYGKETSFNNQEGIEEIVFDDYGLVTNVTPSNYQNIIIRQLDEKIQDDPGFIYLGRVTVTDGIIENVEPSTDVGITHPSTSTTTTTVAPFVEELLVEGTCTNTQTFAIALPTGFTTDNTVVLSLMLKGVAATSDIIPLDSWISLPCTHHFNDTVDILATVNIVMSGTATLSINMYVVEVLSGTPVFTPTLDGVSYKLVIARNS